MEDSVKLRGSTPSTEALIILGRAYSDLGSAIVLLKHGSSQDDRRACFRLLSGVQASCEIVKLAMAPRAQKRLQAPGAEDRLVD